jgi:hypothetical protein
LEVLGKRLRVILKYHTKILLKKYSKYLKQKLTVFLFWRNDRVKLKMPKNCSPFCAQLIENVIFQSRSALN